MIDQLFFIYIVIAVSYNLVSLVFKECTDKQLSPNEPLPSVTMLATLYLIYSSNEISGMATHVQSFLLFSFSIIIFRFGVLKHLVNYDRKLYFSSSARISAALINIAGVTLLIISLVSK